MLVGARSAAPTSIAAPTARRRTATVIETGETPSFCAALPIYGTVHFTCARVVTTPVRTDGSQKTCAEAMVLDRAVAIASQCCELAEVLNAAPTPPSSSASPDRALCSSPP